MLGKSAGEAHVTARDDSGETVPADVRPLDSRRLRLPIEAGIADYVIE